MESWMIPFLIEERDRAEERMIRMDETGEQPSEDDRLRIERSIAEIRARVEALAKK